MASESINYAELEKAYSEVKAGDAEPNMAVMTTRCIIRLYRCSNPDTQDTDEQIIAKLRAGELAIYIGEGIWVLTKEKLSVAGTAYWAQEILR